MRHLLHYLLSFRVPSTTGDSLLVTTPVVLSNLWYVRRIAVPMREVPGVGTVAALLSLYPVVAAIEAAHSLRETMAFLTMIEV